MSWCDVCELFTDEGNIRCTCDDEFKRYCDHCGEVRNIELEPKCSCVMYPAQGGE